MSSLTIGSLELVYKTQRFQFTVLDIGRAEVAVSFFKV